MASKNSTFVHNRIDKLLERNADGTKQFGLRDQFKKNSEALGSVAGQSWLLSHIEVTKFVRELLKQENWLACDTETTGIGSAAEVCEIAFVHPDKSIAFSSLVKPQRSITAGSENVHKISNEDVAGAPTFEGIYPKICELIDGRDFILWYNGDFDLRVCEQSTFEHNLPALPWPPKVDPMHRVAEWCGDWNPRQNGWRWPKLEGGHRAAGDCQELIRALERIATTDLEYAYSLLENSKNPV